MNKDEILCKIFGHDEKPTSYCEWQETEVNFWCKKCGKGFKTFLKDSE
jgi:hypothetical protein